MAALGVVRVACACGETIAINVRSVTQKPGPGGNIVVQVQPDAESIRAHVDAAPELPHRALTA